MVGIRNFCKKSSSLETESKKLTFLGSISSERRPRCRRRRPRSQQMPSSGKFSRPTTAVSNTAMWWRDGKHMSYLERQWPQTGAVLTDGGEISHRPEQHSHVRCGETDATNHSDIATWRRDSCHRSQQHWLLGERQYPQTTATLPSGGETVITDHGDIGTWQTDSGHRPQQHRHLVERQ